MKRIFNYFAVAIVACVAAVGCSQDWASDISSLDERLTRHIALSDEDFNNLFDRITSIEETTIPTINTSIDEANVAIAALKAGKADAAAFAALEEVVNGLKTSKADAAALEALSGKVDKNAASIDYLTGVTTTLTTDLDALESTVAETKAEIENLKKAIADGDKATLEDAIAYAKSADDVLYEALAVVKTDVNALNTKVNEVSTALNTLRGEYDAFVTKTEAKFTSLNESLAATKASLTEVMSAIVAISNQVQSVAFVPEVVDEKGVVYTPVDGFSLAFNDDILYSNYTFTATFKVFPAKTAALVTENTAKVIANVLTTKAVDEYEIDATFEADEENGQVTVTATIANDSEILKNGKFAFALVVENANEVGENDLGSYVTSDYAQAVLCGFRPLTYTLYDASDKTFHSVVNNVVEVPWDKWRNSTRTLFSRPTIGFRDGDKFVSIDEAVKRFGVAKSTINPSTYAIYSYNKSSYTVVDDVWNTTVSVNLDEVLNDETARNLVIDNEVLFGEIGFYLENEGVKYYLDGLYCYGSYRLTYAEGTAASLATVSVPWNYSIRNMAVNNTSVVKVNGNVFPAVGYLYNSEGEKIENSENFYTFSEVEDGAKVVVSGFDYADSRKTYTFKGDYVNDLTHTNVSGKVVVAAAPAKTQTVILKNATSVEGARANFTLIAESFKGNESKYIDDLGNKVQALYASFASNDYLAEVLNVDGKYYENNIDITGVAAVYNGHSVDPTAYIQNIIISDYQETRNANFKDCSYIDFVNGAVKAGDELILTFSYSLYWGVTYNYTITVNVVEAEEE